MGHYEVLGVAPDATPGQIRSAYVRLAREHHPDRVGGSTERMQAINAAWQVLGDPVAREHYDLMQPMPSPRPPADPGGAAGGPTAGPGGPWAWGVPVDPDLADLLDDRPIGGMVRLPPWLAMVPPAVLLMAAVVFLGGLVLRLPAVIALGAVLGLHGALCFLLSPFVALAAGRRPGGGGGGDPHG